MTAPGRVPVFEQTFFGSRDRRAQALAALKGAGFDARDSICPFGEDSDEGKQAWLVADIRTGPEVPDGERQQMWIERAAKALAEHGFALRIHGVRWAAEGNG